MDSDFTSGVSERVGGVVMPACPRRCLVRLETIVPNDGYCFMTELAADLRAGDNLDDPFASPLVLLENGAELGPPHALHAEIREIGEGRFSHWQRTLFFSSSD